MADYVMVIPVVNTPELLRNCLSSFSIPKDNLLLIDNSISGFCKEHESIARVRYFPENLGVGRSWNLGLKEKHDYTIMCSCTMVFPDGLSKLVENLYLAASRMLHIGHAWHCTVLGKKMVEQVGLFDENFYPAYFEDNDWGRRLFLQRRGLEGFDEDTYDQSNLAWLPMKAKSQGDASSIKAGIRVSTKKLLNYYIEKWGGRPFGMYIDHARSKNGYSLPFNKYPLDYFPDSTVAELKEKYGL